MMNLLKGFVGKMKMLKMIECHEKCVIHSYAVFGYNLESDDTSFFTVSHLRIQDLMSVVSSL